jgi:two-component system nitrogen regulation sensor histidine kinase GlnL
MVGAPSLSDSILAGDGDVVLNALAEPVFLLDGGERFGFANQAAEQFFQASAAWLKGRPLAELLPQDSPLFAVIRHAREGGHSVSEAGMTLETPRIGTRFVSVSAAVISERPGCIVVSLQERSIARKIDDQLVHRNAARSVTAMAAMLMHEIKNPLSGIRGAAQLLEANADLGDRELTRLICDETDRVVALIDRMEMFADERPIERSALYIHEVLEHVRRLAQAGFARHVRIVEAYDPSLPPLFGNRDLLIQALLNLVKNAAEALPASGGQIVLSTAFQQGVRLAVGGGGQRVDLPLLIAVQDNGRGIPEELQRHLFEPFVTTKPGGKGLGLALVAKIVGDHGGVIESESEPGRTVFRMRLPMAPRAAARHGTELEGAQV